MPVLLWILKFLGVLLLILLGLIVLALVIPVGIRLDYRGERLQLSAAAGPVTIRLWPPPARPSAAGKKEGKPAGPKKAAPGSAPPEKPGTGANTPSQPAAAKPAATAAQAAGGKKAAPTPEKPQGGGLALPAFLQKRVDAVVDLARRDPLTLARRMLNHLGWFGRRMLRGIRVTHLDVFWTVHCEEASATAIRYGQVMALLNNLLALLRQWMTVRADSLRLEPDFTGHQAAARHISLRVYTHLCIPLVLALRLLWRLWRDPSFQPQSENTPSIS